jgi:hypothetical protein
MNEKLKLVKGSTPKLALVYGMRLVDSDDVVKVEDALVKVAQGTDKRVTMHVIEGSKEQIHRQLLQSIEAFFELVEDTSS